MTTKKSRQARLARRAAAREQASFPQEHQRGGLFVTDELRKALEECKTQVQEIAADCRRRNRKFRDIEFDLELDKDRCLHGLRDPSDGPFPPFTPSDVRRATQIFDQPSFFIDGADSNDIIQGAIGDCWFLSALATMSTAKGLVEKFCVARDEQVGVYGFIFFRDTAWVTVIIDDLLFTSIPKFEELKAEERQLYHGDKENYNKLARKSGKSLYFAKSGTHGETWVPLIEKAYAKLHGNYASLTGGEAGEAIEDLTGGITSLITTTDILDPDAFWTDELLHANKDRLFGCAYGNLNTTRSGASYATVNGLIGGHAYSVLRAVEYKGKRFVVIRNPWGECEWTGPWSDGSKEWTSEWLSALPVLGHTFGNDGEFVMEYKDFLENWDQIDRTLLFDSSWIMSSQWLKVTSRPLGLPWAFGDVSFTVSLPAPSSTVIVLSQLDERYYKPISGRAKWSFDFIIYRKGENKPITASCPSSTYCRSVNAELYLQAGEYVVHVRLVRKVFRAPDYQASARSNFDWDHLTYARVRTEMAISQSIASNFNQRDLEYIPIPPHLFAGQDLSELEAKVAELKLKDQESKAEGATKATETKPDASLANSVSTSTEAPAEGGAELDKKRGDNSTAIYNEGGNRKDDGEGKEEHEDSKGGEKEKVGGGEGGKEDNDEAKGEEDGEEAKGEDSKEAEGGDSKEDKGGDSKEDKGGDSKEEKGGEDGNKDKGEDSKESGEKGDDEDDNEGGGKETDGEEGEDSDSDMDDETDVVFLGLRVYTNKAALAKVDGQLRHTSLAALTRALGLGGNRQATQAVKEST